MQLSCAAGMHQSLVPLRTGQAAVTNGGGQAGSEQGNDLGRRRGHRDG